MTVRRNWILTILQLGVAAAWLMGGVVYVFTPARMAALLGMSDTVRVTLGAAMLFSALATVAGVLIRHRSASVVGLALLSVAGGAFAAYDAFRHWLIFAAYDGALAVVAVGLLFTYGRKS